MSTPFTKRLKSKWTQNTKPDINKPVPEGGWNRMSAHVEDRRTSVQAPTGSAGYAAGASPDEDFESPDLTKPVPHGAPTFDARQHLMDMKAKMARMDIYKPKRR